MRREKCGFYFLSETKIEKLQPGTESELSQGTQLDGFVVWIGLEYVLIHPSLPPSLPPSVLGLNYLSVKGRGLFFLSCFLILCPFSVFCLAEMEYVLG